MQNRKEFIEFLSQKKINDELMEKMLETVDSFLQFSMESKSKDLSVQVKQFSKEKISGQEDAYHRILALIYYFVYNSSYEFISYFISMLGTADVLESHKERIENLFGKEKAEQIFKIVNFPKLGTPNDEYPKYINKYLKQLQEKFTLDECKNILAGNHHKVSLESFDLYVERFCEIRNLDHLLIEKHEDLVKTLQEHCDNGKVWFEQHITQPVVDFVKANQEIQTGIRIGNKVYIQKIPYNPDAFLKENNQKIKRSLACHCPFVRSSINNSQKVSDLWCYCSGGYEKILFDLLFKQSLKVEILNSVLNNENYCRFAIILPDDWQEYPK